MIKLFVSLIVFMSMSFAYSIDNEKIQSQNNFLDSLLDEIEEENISSLDKNAQDEIKKYQIDINDLKKKLEDIRLEKEKNSQESNKEIEKLVKDYNKNLEQLKKTYQYLSSKIKRHNCPDEFTTDSSHKAYCSNNLDYYKKRKRISETKFAPLGIIEVNSESDSERTTLQERER